MYDEYFGESEQKNLIFDFITSNDISRLKRITQDLGDLKNIIHEDTKLSILHWASLKGSLNIQNWLVDKMGFPVDWDDNEYVWTPAHVAVIGGHDMCLDALLMRGPSVVNRPDRRGCTPLHLAAAHGRTHCMTKILKCSRCAPEVNKQCSKNGWSPLMYASWHGRISCVELLIRHGAMTDLTDHDGHTALHLAASEGHLPLVKYFIDHGCQDIMECITAVDNNGFTPQMAAEFNKKNDIVEYLNEKIKDPKTWESVVDIAYPGHIAAINGDLENLKNLLQKGSINVNDIDDKGYTMLHKAATNNKVKIVIFLLESGASIYVRTLGNETALDLAKRKEHTNIIEILEHEYAQHLHFDKKKENKKDKNIYIPILTSLDSTNASFSFDGKRWREQKKENEAELLNFKELLISARERLTTEEIELSVLETDPISDNVSAIFGKKKNIMNIKHEIAKLTHQTEVTKFNLYQITKEPSEKEIEVGKALADCAHQYEEVYDQLLYEKEKREQTEADLGMIRIELLRIRDFILTNEVPENLLSMITSFDSNVFGKDYIPSLKLNELQICKNKQYSLYFEVDQKNKISVTKVNYDSIPRGISDVKTKNLTVTQFIGYVKLLLNTKHRRSRSKRRRRIFKKKNPSSPPGGTFFMK